MRGRFDVSFPIHCCEWQRLFYDFLIACTWHLMFEESTVHSLWPSNPHLKRINRAFYMFCCFVHSVFWQDFVLLNVHKWLSITDIYSNNNRIKHKTALVSVCYPNMNSNPFHMWQLFLLLGAAIFSEQADIYNVALK